MIQITLNWSLNTTTADNILVERSPDGSTGWTQIASIAGSSVSYVDTGLTPLTAYYYRIRLKQGSGFSNYSNIANTTTPDIDLVTTAIDDGATIVYKLNETVGTFVNAVSPGTYDLTAVSGNIVRNVTGISGPEAKAATGSTTNGAGAPNWGHAQGTMPSLIGNKTFTMEMVCKTPVDKNGDIFSHNSATEFGVVGFSVDSGINGIRAAIVVSGQPFNSQSIGQNGVGGLDLINTFHHFVATWDGTTFTGYRDAVQIFAIAIGPGNTGIAESGGAGTIIALFGTQDFNNNNVAATVDFFALYTGTVLSPSQVTTHKNRSGV